MEKLFILGIILIVTGAVVGIFVVINYLEILDAIKYLESRPPGSSSPLIDYGTLYFRLSLFIILISIGFVLQKKFRQNR